MIIMNAVLFASFQLFFSLPFLLLHLFTLPIFLSVREFRSRICFRLMFALGITDSLQLLISIVFSLFVLLDVKFGTIFEGICGALMQLSWDVVIFLHFLLAANRLLIFVKASFKPSVLNKEPKAEHILFNSLLSLIWALFFALLFAFQTPYLGVTFDRDYLTFFINKSLPLVPIFRLCEFYWSCFLLPTTTSFYLCIVFLLKKYRKKSSDAPFGKTDKRSTLDGQEWRILGQSVAMFVMMAVIVAVWDLIDLLSWTPPDGLILLNMFLYLLFCGISPMLYLCTLPFVITFCACIWAVLPLFYRFPFLLPLLPLGGVLLPIDAQSDQFVVLLFGDCRWPTTQCEQNEKCPKYGQRGKNNDQLKKGQSDQTQQKKNG